MPDDIQPPDLGNSLADPQQLAQVLQSANPIDNVSPPQQQSQAGRLQAGMADYAGMLLAQAKQLSQPDTGFRKGFGGAMLHAAGLQTPREQGLQAVNAQLDALRGATGVQDSGIKQQALDYSQQMVEMQRPDGTIVRLPQALMGKLGGAYIRGDASTANTDMRTSSNEKIAGLKIGSNEKIAGDKTASQERIGAAHDATRLAVAKLNGMYSLRRASISASAGGGTAAGDYLDALREGMPITSVPPKLRGQALALAKSEGVNVTFQKLSPSAQRMQDAISELTPVLGDLVDALEPYKTQDSIGDKGHAAIEGLKYKMGFSTDDPLYQNFNKVGNLVTLLGTTPYTSIGRGKYLFDEAKKHLPKPGVDTPKLAYEKAQILEKLLGQMEEGVRTQQFNKPSGMGGKKDVVKWGRDANGVPVRLP